MSTPTEKCNCSDLVGRIGRKPLDSPQPERQQRGLAPDFRPSNPRIPSSLNSYGEMTLAEREELRRVGRENNAVAGLVCPTDVKAAFNFEFDDIDIDVPLEELLVEASKETPRWRVMLTPLPRASGETDSQPTSGRGDRGI